MLLIPRHGVVCAVTALILLTGTTIPPVSAWGASHGRPTGSPTPEGVMPGAIVVKLAPDMLQKGTGKASIQSIVDALQRYGATGVHRTFPTTQFLNKAGERPLPPALSRIYTVTLPATANPVEVAGRARGVPGVEYAEPRYVHSIDDTPNDPGITSQTAAFSRINLFNGWSIAKGNATVVIATVDGGTFWQHEDLNPNLWINSPEDINGNGKFDPGAPPAGDEDGIDQDGNGKVDDVIGWNFANNTNNPNGLGSQPNNASHGTATASIFGAATNNGTGMAGTAWNCLLMPICAGAVTAGDNYLDSTYEGVVYAFLKGADIINCSWGRYGGSSQFEQDVIDAVTEGGSLIVAAAGNSSANNDSIQYFPASCRNILSVGATNSTSDAKASFSNFGATVDVFAPGVQIWSALTNGGYGNVAVPGWSIDGTSFASPIVAGLAGIIKSLHPFWGPVQIAAQIRATADPIESANAASLAGKLGRGKVNAARALTEAHPAIVIVQQSISTLSGSTLFVSGDTIAVRLTVANVGDPATALNATDLQFTASSATSTISVLQGSASVPYLGLGQQLDLPPFLFRVLPMSNSGRAVLRLDWISNGTDRDATAYPVTVFPSVPLWTVQLGPVDASFYTVKAVNAGTVWAAGERSSLGGAAVVRSTNAGDSWMDASGDLPAVAMYTIEAIDDVHAWVGSGAGKIYATSNGGTSWAEQPYPGTQTPFIDGVAFVDANNGFAMGDPPSGQTRWVVLNTTNGGQTWAHCSNEPVGASGEAGWNNSFWWNDASHGWFGTNKNKVWRTTDGGATWQSAASGATNSYGVSFRDNAYGIAVHDNGIFARTTDGGASWTTGVSGSATVLTAVAYVRGTAYAWLTDRNGLMFRSRSDGASWVPEATYPISGTLLAVSFADTSNGWATTINGEILKFSPTAVTAVEELSGPTLPREFVLEQNFPNPFNPSTTIRYSVPVTSRVRLTIVDILGRQVATLVDGVVVSGRHDVTFRASSIASGVYFYRLDAHPADGGGGWQQTKKLVVLQ